MAAEYNISKNGVEEDKTKNVINALWCEAEDENGVVIPWLMRLKSRMRHFM